MCVGERGCVVLIAVAAVSVGGVEREENIKRNVRGYEKSLNVGSSTVGGKKGRMGWMELGLKAKETKVIISYEMTEGRRDIYEGI